MKNAPMPALLADIYVTNGIISYFGDNCLLFDGKHNFNLKLIHCSIKYSFTQADEILPKINTFKQYYTCEQELVYCMHDTVT